ncbi:MULTISPECIES: hypothetical protein [unclassified Paenibacillus]|uniref:hypothetical protein n=1 Tax=unclassified Paenibacillus TaxID=185978 RepID=UPI000B829F84|nr:MULTISPECIES: hypothetical protein [unclassified Paenibacillus]QLG37815.1 hypothetical protein HW560_06635 [Paenibacillus sp. E222]
MSKGLGLSEVEQLSVNLYVKSVSTKGIAYTDEFKQLFIASNQQGKLPREILSLWIRCSDHRHDPD